MDRNREKGYTNLCINPMMVSGWITKSKARGIIKIYQIKNNTQVNILKINLTAKDNCQDGTIPLKDLSIKV